MGLSQTIFITRYENHIKLKKKAKNFAYIYIYKHKEFSRTERRWTRKHKKAYTSEVVEWSDTVASLAMDEILKRERESVCKRK